MGPKYADCPTVDVVVEIEAPAPAVWSLVVDIDLPSRFSPEFRGAEWLDGVAAPSVGARFLGRNEHPVAGSWQTVCTVVDHEPGARFGYVVEDPEQPAAAWRFELAPLPDERVQLRYLARIGPGRSLLNVVIDADPAAERRIVAARLAELRRNMTATVLGIKSMAEQRFTPTAPRDTTE